MTTYVSEVVGNAEYIKTVKGKHRIDYYFKEPTTGIEFVASTFASGTGPDGSTFYYTEHRETDFYDKMNAKAAFIASCFATLRMRRGTRRNMIK